MNELLFLILGILGLGFGGDLIMRGAINIGNHFKISPIILGLTVLTFGSNLPEFVININGAIQKLGGTETSGLMIGDVLGSCLGQVGIILGIVGLFGTLKMTKKQMLRDGFTMIIAPILLLIVSLNGNISRIEGIIFLIIYAFYLLSLYREEKVKKTIAFPRKYHLMWSTISLFGGFVLILTASHFTIENAVLLSEKWDIAQSVIGILMVGIGTSLPELAISISAIRKGAHQMAIGNLLGSNIFDIFVPIGTAALISELEITNNLIAFDMPVLILLSITVVFLFRYKGKLRKRESVLLIIIFCIYAAVKLLYFS